MIEIIVTVFLLFLVPLQYIEMKQDLVCQVYVQNETIYFVDSVRNLGYVNRSMYQLFQKRIEQTNHVYHINLVHYKRLQSEETGGNQYVGTYTELILDELYGEEDTKYSMNKGDFFSVEIVNKDKTLSTRIFEMLIDKTVTMDEIYVTYGGGIRDEII